MKLASFINAKPNGRMTFSSLNFFDRLGHYGKDDQSRIDCIGNLTGASHGGDVEGLGAPAQIFRRLDDEQLAGNAVEGEAEL